MFAVHGARLDSDIRRLLAGRPGDCIWDGVEVTSEDIFGVSVGCGRELFDATLVIWTSLLQGDVDGAQGDAEAMATDCCEHGEVCSYAVDWCVYFQQVQQIDIWYKYFGEVRIQMRLLLEVSRYYLLWFGDDAFAIWGRRVCTLAFATRGLSTDHLRRCG